MYEGIAKGFDLATGEILAWLNSDDMYEPGVLLRVGSYFARHPHHSVIYFDDTVWKQGWRVANRLQKFVGLAELLRGHILYQASVFFRRSADDRVGGLDRQASTAGGRLSTLVETGSPVSIIIRHALPPLTNLPLTFYSFPSPFLLFSSSHPSPLTDQHPPGRQPRTTRSSNCRRARRTSDVNAWTRTSSKS